MLKRHASTPFALVAGCAFLLPWILDLSGPAVPCAYAQDSLYIYPKNGQSDEQQKKDRYECHMWAVQQTGYDPTAPQQSQAPAGGASSGGGQVVRGAGRGAALGAIGGAIAGDAGTGAAVGAAVGGAGGAMRRAGQRRQQEEEQQQAAAASQKSRSDYNRALSTCMEARGYQVN